MREHPYRGSFFFGLAGTANDFTAKNAKGARRNAEKDLGKPFLAPIRLTPYMNGSMSISRPDLPIATTDVIPGTHSADASLIAAAVGGAEAAFRELFRRHTPHLLQFVTRVLGKSAGDAEDVVQDTWIRAYPALVTFRNESSFSTWLCSIGLRAALDSMRRNRRHSADALFDDDWAQEPPRNEDRMDIESAIAQLAPGYRMVLVLHDVEGFTHEEIGMQLGIAPGTSKAQLFKARRVMRALLTGREKNDVQ